MASLIELADRLWTGFVNLTVLRSEEGAVLIDTGSFLPAQHERRFAAAARDSIQRSETT